MSFMILVLDCSSVVPLMHLSMLITPEGGGGSGICGVFDHQLHPHPGDFD